MSQIRIVLIVNRAHLFDFSIDKDKSIYICKFIFDGVQNLLLCNFVVLNIVFLFVQLLEDNYNRRQLFEKLNQCFFNHFRRFLLVVKFDNPHNKQVHLCHKIFPLSAVILTLIFEKEILLLGRRKMQKRQVVHAPVRNSYILTFHQVYHLFCEIFELLSEHIHLLILYQLVKQQGYFMAVYHNRYIVVFVIPSSLFELSLLAVFQFHNTN